MRIVAENAFVIELDPVVLLVVDINVLHPSVETEEAFQLTTGISLHFLRHWVVDTVVHALLQPQLTVIGLHNLFGIVVPHRRGVALVRIEHLDTVTVIAVQSIGRSDPNETFGVTIHTVHLRVRQAVTGIQPAKLHLGNGSLNDEWPQPYDEEHV